MIMSRAVFFTREDLWSKLFVISWIQGQKIHGLLSWLTLWAFIAWLLVMAWSFVVIGLSTITEWSWAVEAESKLVAPFMWTAGATLVLLMMAIGTKPK